MQHAELEELLKHLGSIPLSEQREILKLVDRLERIKQRDAARISFMDFVRLMMPHTGEAVKFIEGAHHRQIARAFEGAVDGDERRVLISMPPRFGKSVMSSILLPAWFLGKYPNKKIIQATHTADLSVNFGRKVRDLIASDAYREVFPEVELRADTKAAGRWTTTKGGSYFAIGVGGAVAGYGADLCIVDDPHSEQDAKSGNPEVFAGAYEWYVSGIRTRLMPNASVVVLHTRWSQRDLIGSLLNHMAKNPDSDEWKYLELPALLPSGNSMWPEFWTTEQLLATKASMSEFWWQAQYQQNPTGDQTALVKREWWRRWQSSTSPTCEFVIQAWDTAFRATERSDYSACTTWGVFRQESPDGTMAPAVILLDSFKARLEFPDLKRQALELYREWEPDAFIIEGKASGDPLAFELRAMGIPVSVVTPTTGQTKFVRLNSVSDLFQSGLVWAPEERWADELIEEVAAFPGGLHDDSVDSMSMALARFRAGGFIALPSDDRDDSMPPHRAVEYY